VTRCLVGPGAKMPSETGLWAVPFLVGYRRALGEFNDELRRSGYGGWALLSAAAKYSDRKEKCGKLDLGPCNELLRSSIAGSYCAIEMLEREVEQMGYGDRALKAATERLSDYMEAIGGSGRRGS
jgi:hypothetical protein